MRAVGIMSGTSVDGIDVALVDIRPSPAGVTLDLVRASTVPFDAALRTALLAALPPHAPAPASVAALDRALGVGFARAAADLVAGEHVDFVASHGLTLFHRGEACETAQIGSPYALRDALGASVVFDFRRADCSAGGHGAPLVPYVDAQLFASSECDVVALNLGGIANVTILLRGAPATAATAWDTGPAGIALDAFVRGRTHGAEAYDRDGAYAAAGRADARVLGELIAREAFYLVQPPPKSTGRERFGDAFLAAHRDLLDGLSLADGCATLTAFTVETIVDALDRYGPAAARIVASGGGTHNRALIDLLARRLRETGRTFATSAQYGVDPDAKEAIAFALLGYETLRGRPANVPRATGAARPVVLGAIVPHALRALLAKMEAEAAANGAA